MNTKTKQNSSKKPCLDNGLTLVELMASIALLSILAVAVALATSRSFQTTGETRVTLNELQRRSYLVEKIVDRIQWATAITVLESDSIFFMFPDPATGMPSLAAYYWDDVNYDLYLAQGVQPAEIIQQNVQSFLLEPDQIDQDGTTLLSGINLTIQIGTDENDTLVRYIGLPNTPTSPGG